MQKTIFYSFLRTKVEEEDDEISSGEEVQIRPNPKVLHLFPWDIRKILTIEDVGFYGGLQLSEGQVRDRIFEHWDKQIVSIINLYKDKVQIVVHDLDTDTYHKLFMWKFPEDENYTIYEFWIEEFVRRRELKVGMVIGMYWNLKRGTLCFSVLESN